MDTCGNHSSVALQIKCMHLSVQEQKHTFLAGVRCGVWPLVLVFKYTVYSYGWNRNKGNMTNLYWYSWWTDWMTIYGKAFSLSLTLHVAAVTQHHSTSEMRSNPLNTWRNNNVVITSKRRHFDVITSKWRCFDVITTSLLRNVFAGN